MAENNNIFVGSGKQVFDNMVEISVCLSDIPREHTFEYNGKKYVKLNVTKKKEGVDQYGKTHSVKINTYRPEEKAKPEPAKVEVEEDDDDLPF
tara:strand:+ start:4057 stop:4335 length:279 start_codon:yes stop_codon:yes gene_type:complete